MARARARGLDVLVAEPELRDAIGDDLSHAIRRVVGLAADPHGRLTDGVGQRNDRLLGIGGQIGELAQLVDDVDDGPVLLDAPGVLQRDDAEALT